MFFQQTRFVNVRQFLLIFLEDISLSVGPMIPLFWTFGDVSSGVQSQSGLPFLHLSEAYVIYVSSDSLL